MFMFIIDVAAPNAFKLFRLKYPGTGVGLSFFDNIKWNSKNIFYKDSCQDNFDRQRRISIETIAKALITPCIDERGSRLSLTSLRGIPNQVRNSMERSGVVLGPRTARPSSPASPNTTPKRSRCAQCVGNDNKYSNKCQQCGKFVCDDHCQKLVTCLCSICAKAPWNTRNRLLKSSFFFFNSSI